MEYVDRFYSRRVNDNVKKFNEGTSETTQTTYEIRATEKLMIYVRVLCSISETRICFVTSF